MSPRRVRLAVLGVVGAAIVGPVVAALAYFTISGGAGAAARADYLAQGNTPEATPIAHMVNLVWEVSGLNEREIPADAYEVRRYREGDELGTLVECTMLAGLVSIETPDVTTSCVDLDAYAGTYRYTVTPRLNEWTGKESGPSDPVVIAPPTVTVPETTYVDGGAAHPTLDGVELTGFRNDEIVDIVLVPVEGEGEYTVGEPVPTDADGTATPGPLAVPPNVPDGVYRVSAVSTVAEPVIPSEVVVLVDRTAPALQVPSVPADWVKTDVNVVLAASDDGPGTVDRVTYALDGGAPVDAAPGSAVIVTAAGTHTLTFTATDSFGNTSAPSAPLTIRIDKTAPTVPWVGKPKDVKSSHVLTAEPTDALSGVASVQFLTCPVVDCSSFTPLLVLPDTTVPYEAPVAGLADGEYQLIVRVTDVAGNVSPDTLLPLTVDNVAPRGRLTVDPVIGRSAQLTASFNDPSRVARIVFSYSVDGVNWTTITTVENPPAGDATVTWNTVGLTAGEYIVRAEATDKAVGSPGPDGNTGEANQRRTPVLFGPSAVTLGNGGGGRGRIAQGDTVTIRFNRALQLDAICPAWTLSAASFTVNDALTVVVTAGAVGQPDKLTLSTTCAGAPKSLGTITMAVEGNYITTGSRTFGPAGSIMTAVGGDTLELTFGTRVGAALEQYDVDSVAIYESPDTIVSTTGLLPATSRVTALRKQF